MTLPAIGVIGLTFMCIFLVVGLALLVLLVNDDYRYRLCEVLASYRSPKDSGTVGRTYSHHHGSRYGEGQENTPSSAFAKNSGKPPVIDQQAYERTTNAQGQHVQASHISYPTSRNSVSEGYTAAEVHSKRRPSYSQDGHTHNQYGGHPGGEGHPSTQSYPGVKGHPGGHDHPGVYGHPGGQEHPRVQGHPGVQGTTGGHGQYDGHASSGVKASHRRSSNRRNSKQKNSDEPSLMYPNPGYSYSSPGSPSSPASPASPTDSGDFSYSGNPQQQNGGGGGHDPGTEHKELKGILRNSNSHAVQSGQSVSPVSSQDGNVEKRVSKTVHVDGHVDVAQIH